MVKDRCAMPEAANPSGAPPNFVHRHMFRPIFLGTILPFMILSVIFVMLRIMGTLRKERKLFLDDWLALPTLMLALTFGGISIRVTTGYTHVWNMSWCQVDKIQHDPISAAGLLLYLPTIWAAKGVICALYLRIFASVRWIRIATWTIFTYYTLLCCAGWSLYLSHFIMVKFNVARAGPLDLRPYQFVHTGSSILIDLLLLSIPIRPILQMKTLSLRKRLGLLAVFLSGFGATICTILLVVYGANYYYFPNSKQAYDWSWFVCILNLLSAIEIFMTLILGCVPGAVSTWRNVIRDSWLVGRIRSMFGVVGGNPSVKEIDFNSEQGPKEESLKVRNNDRTLRLETISV